MAKWQCRKGLHDLGNGCHAYLQPDGVNADRLRRSILQCELQRGVAEAQAGPLSKRSIADIAPAAASESGASKSGGTIAFPVREPRRRFGRFSRVTSGTRRATGFPALAMMISSPAAASSTSRENCVLAA
jgi:hypothetical protein